MAKGEGFGLYQPESIDSDNPQEIVSWATRELYKVSAALQTALARKVEFLNVAPAKPREGDIRGADGINWNPGAGKGIYAFYSGAWNKLG